MPLRASTAGQSSVSRARRRLYRSAALSRRAGAGARRAGRRSRLRQPPAWTVPLAPRACAKGAGRHHRLNPEAARLRLSQRHFDRRLDLLDRQAGPLDACRRVHHPRQGQGAHVCDLWRADAGHGEAHLEGHRSSCRRSAGLSGLAWLRSSAARLRRRPLRHHAARHAGDHRRWPYRPGVRVGPWTHPRYHGQGGDRGQDRRQADSIAEPGALSCRSSCRAPT